MLETILGLILPGLTEILKRIIPDPEKAAEAQAQITALLYQNQQAIMTAMKDVMVADASSQDSYASRARPTVVYWSMGTITLIAGLGVFGAADPVITALAHVPDKLWDLMTVGIGAYILGRTGEKVAQGFFNKGAK